MDNIAPDDKPWFVPDDINSLVAASRGFSLLDGANCRMLSNGLDNALRTGFFQNYQHPSAVQERLRFKKIEAAAAALLGALDYSSRNPVSPSSGQFRIRSRTSDTHEALISRFNQGRPKNDNSALQQKHVQSARESIEAIQFASSVASRTVVDSVAKRGKHSATGVRFFYSGLAPVYLATFGIRPPLTGRAPDRNEVAPLWSEAVVALALQRRKGRILAPEEKDLFQDLTKIKTPAAHAKRMRQGWLDWISLSTDDERWPPHVWMNMLTGARVPDWLS